MEVSFDVSNPFLYTRDADKRVAQMKQKAKQAEEREEKKKAAAVEKENNKTAANTTNNENEKPDVESTATVVTRIEKKKAESDLHLIPSLPKAQSLPTHPHMFRERKKVCIVLFITDVR